MRLGLLIPLILARCWYVVPYIAAIPLKVSPDFTVYVVPLLDVGFVFVV